MMKISELDKNFEVTSKLDIDGIKYVNLLDAPVDIYGLYKPRELGRYMRMPEDIAKNVSEGVQRLNMHTSGGRIRFRTNSSYIALSVKADNGGLMSHMPLTGSHGFDLYIYDGTNDCYGGSFIPPADSFGEYEAMVNLRTPQMREITIHFPLYSGVGEVYIGLDENAELAHGRQYRPIAPVLYYGSSITQGGCASRPGNNYPAVIARELNIDFTCLGFSGNAKAEPEMISYLAGIKSSVFVCDYDHNAPSVEHLRATHMPLYRAYRDENPDTPIIFVTRPTIACRSRKEENKRRITVFETFRTAVSEGDENVYFVDGASLFEGGRHTDCTVDGIHPTDLGFARMASVIGYNVRDALGAV